MKLVRPETGKKSIFPSYETISRKLKQQQQKEYTQKLNKINKRIGHLKQRVNFNEQHRRLAKKLVLDYKKQYMEERPQQTSALQFPQLSIAYNSKIPKYADSVNEYLINSDQQQQNNYEMHLKFRKKALQREIQEQQKKQDSKHGLINKSTEQCEQQQRFYRSMYKNDMYSGVGIGLGMNKKQQNSKQLKQMQSRCAHLEENRKKLLELYLPYVEALGNTNIVKWRVLNS